MKNFAAIILILMISVASNFAQSSQVTVKIYFLNEKFNPNLEDCRMVYPVERTIPKTAAVAQAALNELFKGVTSTEKTKGYVSFSSEETKGILKSVKVKKGSAYINFDKVVYDQLGSATSSCGGGFFSSIEKTLFQFPTIKKIFYAIEGSPRDFYEWVQVGDCPKELKNCSGKNF